MKPPKTECNLPKKLTSLIDREIKKKSRELLIYVLFEKLNLKGEKGIAAHVTFNLESHKNYSCELPTWRYKGELILYRSPLYDPLSLDVKYYSPFL